MDTMEYLVGKDAVVTIKDKDGVSTHRCSIDATHVYLPRHMGLITIPQRVAAY